MTKKNLIILVVFFYRCTKVSQIVLFSTLKINSVRIEVKKFKKNITKIDQLKNNSLYTHNTTIHMVKSCIFQFLTIFDKPFKQTL